jgi:alpha-tubulin suppressor-like RCC1 family protein
MKRENARGNRAYRGRSGGARLAVSIALAASSALVAIGVATPAGAASNQILESWGYNVYGQLGNGSTTNSSVPIPVSLPSGVGVTDSAAGGYHSLAIGTDGKLYAWGQNGFGQLGNGTTVNQSTPIVVQLPSGVHATQVAAGADDSFALGSDGNVYAWGDNSLNELGNGGGNNSSTPVRVSIPAGVTVTAIAAGQYHTLGIASNGKVYGWGYDGTGQLGNSSRTTPPNPVVTQFPTGVTATSIAAGGYHSMAIGSDGKLYTWGDNNDGQLGDGTEILHLKPQPVTLPNSAEPTGLAAGLYHSMVIGSDGKIYAWGYNLYGQLGDGTTTLRESPVAITLPSGATPSSITAGQYDSLALLPNGTVYAWGQNGFGQLGIGTMVDASSPTQVTAPPYTAFVGLASGSDSSHTLAIAVPTQTSTITSLIAAVTSPTYGQSETLTAVVTGSDGGGTVAFADGVSPISGCGAVALSLVGSSEQAQCTISRLTAGVHNLKATYSGDAGSSGSASTALPLTVVPAPLVITGSSAAVTYGTAPAPVVASFAGFVNGDGPSALSSQPMCSTTATATSPSATYPTTCSGAVGANYSITYAAGQIVVAPAPLSISASSGTMSYGGSVPAITPNFVGFVNGDTPSSLTAAPTCTTTATSSSGVGSYPSTCAGAVDSNYVVSYTAGQVTVGAAPLLVTASSVATTYGTAATAITPSYSGFLNGDTSASLTTQASCTTTATSTSNIGTYPSSCTGAADPNYDISYVGGTVTVTPAPVTVTALSTSMTYGGSVPTVSPTIDGLQNGEGASVLGGGLACTTTASPTSPVGAYDSSCSGAVDPNYAITYVDGSIAVTQAALTVTASSGTLAYGGDVPAIAPTVAGLQNGEDASVLGAGLTCGTTATTTSPVGEYVSSCSGASDPNYSVTYVAGTVGVTPAPLNITASSGSSIYGDPVPAISYAVDGLQNGETSTVLGAGLQCETTSITGSPVGTYPSMCSGAVDGNYTITYVEGIVSVTTAPLTITASSAVVTYGDSVPGVTASYVGFVNGDTSLATPPVCSTSASTGSPAGTYATSCSSAADPNYTISYVSGAIVIGTADLLIVASPVTMTYGDTPPAVTASYVGLTNGDTAGSLSTAPTCSTPATSSSPAGSYAATCSGAVDGNYTISYVDSTVTVAPAPLTVTASSGSQAYGAAAPNITPAYSGFVNGDTATSLTTPASCLSAALPTSPVGSYDSSCSGAVDPNYTIGYVDGTVAITPAALTITASSDSAVYGGTTPAIVPQVSGLQNSEDVSVLGAGLSCSTVATASSPVGSYPSTCTGASDSNYSISYVDGIVVVAPAAVTVTASSGSFTYGSTPPAVVPTVAGLQNGDAVSSLGSGLTCATTATADTPVASYPSTCTGAVDANYQISYVPGVVQELAAPLVVAASSSSMTYGSTPAAVTPTYAGFVNGEDPSVLNDLPTCATSATPNSPVGTYPSTCSGASDPNYAISYVPGNVVVGASALVISASSGTQTYGSTPATPTPTYSGFVNGDGPGSLTSLPACVATATASSAVGAYATSCSGAVDPNYSISYTPGSDHVVAAPLTVSASSATMVFGGQTPVINPTITGFVNGNGPSALGAGLSCATAAGPTSPVGSYSSTCSGASDANYSVTYTAGTVTVAPAVLTVTANNESMNFGSAVPTLTSTITGFVNGQTLATSGVTGSSACTTTATSTSTSGSYPITCGPGTLSAGNYTFVFVAGTLTVSSTKTLACLTIGSVTVLAGQSVRVAPGCSVIGSITVNAGGSFDAEGALVLGSLVAKGGTVRLCSTSIALLLSSTGATAPVVIGDGTSSCGGSILIGGISVNSGTGGVSIRQASALAVVTVKGNSGGVDVANNTIVGSLTVTGNTGVVVDHPNTVIGRSQLQ